jgi:hypothetical protein
MRLKFFARKLLFKAPAEDYFPLRNAEALHLDNERKAIIE